MTPSHAVLLPGTASDEVFIASVFTTPLAHAGVMLEAPPSRSVTARLAALDAAWDGVPLLVGGVSLGAHVAASWAVAHPERCAGLLLALPAWTGAPHGAPAASAAAASAAAVTGVGVAGALADVTGWLGAELRRAWTRYGDDLVPALTEAATCPAPTLAQLAGLTVPVGVAAFEDDPVHPAEVARAWADALPRSVLRTTTLADLGADRTSLGRAAVDAWRAAAG
ncbi:alpha/beta hydrolase [Actinosynnema sp. NPDC020468]|uniref:alpha/beta fold hydrolase n=1 Tax=Actinosynnema sp. NPDC020468 TaxID=3154488 RepID=UPI0033D6B275